MSIPRFLTAYETMYQEDPRAACLRWFRDARYGLFIHFGLYSLLGRGEWVQFHERIRVGDYASLQQVFTADSFDAEAIAQLAVDAGMKYVNITTRHHDSFCLWDSAQTSFNSVQAPCGRDLVAELAAACDRHGLGLCLYYSHGRDWRHPHAPNLDEYPRTARPDYDPPEPLYAYGDAHHLELYLEFMNAQVKELLSNYGPIAAIWLDGVATPRSGDTDAFRMQDFYDLIHSLQPHVLVSYKDQITGTEDFRAPEHGWDLAQIQAEEKPCEVCAHVNRNGWGYRTPLDLMSADEVWTLLEEMGGAGCNLLLNIDPLPDGSIIPAEAEVLRQVGKRLKRIRDKG